MKYDDEWVDMEKIMSNQEGVLTDMSMIGSGAVFFAGAVNFYVRSLSFLGVFFSSPLLVSFDPIPLLLISKKERLRRRKKLKKAGESEDGHLGDLLDGKSKGENKI